MGLGNPGIRYAGTRHNVGFMVVRRLAKAWNIPLNQRVCRSEVGVGVVGGHPVGLASPQTMMNASGEAVPCLMDHFRVGPSTLLVVCDDVALPLGTIRIRAKGTDGGHHGLASILEATGSEAIARLRIGILKSRAGKDLTPFVLGRFEASEKELLEATLQRALRVCEVWVSRGVTAAMDQFNKKVSTGV